MSVIVMVVLEQSDLYVLQMEQIYALVAIQDLHYLRDLVFVTIYEFRLENKNNHFVKRCEFSTLIKKRCCRKINLIDIGGFTFESNSTTLCKKPFL